MDTILGILVVACVRLEWCSIKDVARSSAKMGNNALINVSGRPKTLWASLSNLARGLSFFVTTLRSQISSKKAHYGPVGVFSSMIGPVFVNNIHIN